MLHPVTLLATVALTLACLTNQAAAEDLDVKGVKIHYEIAGKGEPVVLIHGLFASGFLNWKLPGITDDLNKNYRTIAIDMPGHGMSDKPADKSAYGAQMVEDVVAVLDHLKIKKAHIVGYSMGGMVTVKLMTRYPERVKSATVAGMGWFRDGTGLENLGKKLPASGIGPPPEFFQAFGGLTVTEKELKNIDLPVTVIVGDKDWVKGVFVAPLRGVRKDWPLVEIEDASHLSCLLKPKFREEINAWLKKNSQ